MFRFLLTLLLIPPASGLSSGPIIDVVYPRAGPGRSIPHIAKVDSNFIFGSIYPPEAQLWINGIEVPLRKSGAYFAFLPVDWNTQTYQLKGVAGAETTVVNLPFSIPPSPPPPQPPPVKPPVAIEIIGGVGRNHPLGTYYYFPPPQLKVIATDWERGFWKVPLGKDLFAWFDQNQTKVLDIPPHDFPSVIGWLEVTREGRDIVCYLPLKPARLWRVSEINHPPQLVVELYRVVSHLDRIAYRPGSELVREVRWEACGEEAMTLTFYLSQPVWGYFLNWSNDTLKIRLRPPPPVSRGSLKGLKIVLDPGHGGEQEGAIGPLRTTEKEVNLNVALAVEKGLLRAGAEVLLTRREDLTLPLSQRTQIAIEWGGDLFISLHHNALPDGINPNSTICGTSLHYYHPHSRPLAETLKKHLVKELGFPDEGIYYHDLAVARNTAMPSVLIELAHIILPEQEERIRDPDYPSQVAKAILKALKEYSRSLP